MSIIFRTQNKGVFDLIKRLKLSAPCQTLAKELMTLDTKQALAVFMNTKDFEFDSDEIVSKLESNCYLLYLVRC